MAQGLTRPKQAGLEKKKTAVGARINRSKSRIEAHDLADEEAPMLDEEKILRITAIKNRSLSLSLSFL